MKLTFIINNESDLAAAFKAAYQALHGKTITNAKTAVTRTYNGQRFKRDVVFEAIRKRGSATCNEICRDINAPQNVVSAHIKHLLDEGRLQRVGLAMRDADSRWVNEYRAVKPRISTRASVSHDFR